MLDIFDSKFHCWFTTETLFSLPAPNTKNDGEHLKGIPLPPNPAQVPNPIQPHRPKEHVPAEPVHHRQSESFHTL